MAMRVKCGFSQKIGQPNYGSLGASCELDFELDPMLLSNGVDAFRVQLRDAYIAARLAVEEQLRKGAEPAKAEVPALDPDRNGQAFERANGHSTNGNGQTNGHAVVSATEKQLVFLSRLVKGIRGLNNDVLQKLVDRRYDKSLGLLTKSEASGLIDLLVSVKDGAVSLSSVMGDANHA